MRMILNILGAAAIALSATSCSFIDNQEVAPTYEKSTLVNVGDTAPDFTVNLISGESVTLSQFQGKTVLLVFFDSKCPDCQAQLALLDGVINTFADKKFEVLTISRGEKRDAVREYIDNMGYKFKVGVDPTKEIYSLYATYYVPRCYVIDSLGHVVALSAEYDSAEFELIVKVIDSLTAL